MAEKAPLVVQDLTFRYRVREEPAIQDISFELQAGEVLLVAGTSGCGKTTLVRCINGLIPRTYKGELEGAIRLLDRETASMSLAQISHYVGTVLQDPERQILGTKVLNEVAFGLENLGMPREDILDRVHQTMAQMGLRQLGDRDTFSLSGGEKQKVALAGVLAMQPSLLVLDEPLASLDPMSAQESLDRIRQLADQGMAVVIVEHRVEDVLRINPDRILYLSEGQIKYLGPVAGFEAAVDPRDVKLPASVIMEHAKAAAAASPYHPQVGKKGKNGRTLVRFEEVSFSYEEGKQVLEEVNTEIQRGDVIAVLGPNGAGKTTLVKHAIGLLKPKRGQVLVGGKSTADLSVAEVANTLGYVFQSPSHMLFAPTVREELSFGPKNLGHPPERVERDVESAIEIMNLGGMEEDAPLSLSFGQRKRVSIAAILAMESKILVMDEPTAGQDYRNYMEFMDSILDIHSFEAVLFITHDVDLAVVYANRVWLIQGGRLILDGPPEEVLADLERLQEARLLPTSLLQANLDRLERTGGFMRAEALAHAAA